MQEKRYTLTADFEIQGRLAYLSHQETLTLFQRALVRAEVPLIYSGGFNPRPRLSMPLPRSVGTQSSVERICVGLSAVADPDIASIRCALESQLPDGCRLLDTRCIEGKQSFYAVSVQYVFRLMESLDLMQRQHLTACQDAVTNGQSIEIQRYRAKKRKWEIFDLSPFVAKLTFSEDRVEVTCRVSQAGTARIDELLQWMSVSAKMLKEPVRRVAIQWQAN